MGSTDRPPFRTSRTVEALERGVVALGEASEGSLAVAVWAALVSAVAGTTAWSTVTRSIERARGWVVSSRLYGWLTVDPDSTVVVDPEGSLVVAWASRVLPSLVRIGRRSVSGSAVIGLLERFVRNARERTRSIWGSNAARGTQLGLWLWRVFEPPEPAETDRTGNPPDEERSRDSPDDRRSRDPSDGEQPWEFDDE